MQKSCKICGSATSKIYNKQKTDTYYKCSSCDFIFIEEGKILPFDEQKAVYDKHDNTLENEGYVKMFENFMDKAIFPFSSGLKTCLEFGCGPGPVLAALIRWKGFEVDVYDPVYYPNDYTGKTYDIITSTEVFEHLPNPIETIEKLYPILNTSGILAIMTQFHSNSDEDFSNWWYIRDKTHIAFYNENSLRKIAEIFNLEILFCDAKKMCTFRKL